MFDTRLHNNLQHICASVEGLGLYTINIASIRLFSIFAFLLMCFLIVVLLTEYTTNELSAIENLNLKHVHTNIKACLPFVNVIQKYYI